MSNLVTGRLHLAASWPLAIDSHYHDIALEVAGVINRRFCGYHTGDAAHGLR